MLALLAGIAVSGFAMRYVARSDITALEAFVLGLIYFDWQPIPAAPLLLLHIVLVSALMILFPFSKLLHAPGVFFSPARNQADDSRSRRYLASWAERAGE